MREGLSTASVSRAACAAFVLSRALLPEPCQAQQPAAPPAWGAARVHFSAGCLRPDVPDFECAPLRARPRSTTGHPDENNRDFAIRVPADGILSLSINGGCSGPQPGFDPRICWTRSEVGEPSDWRGPWEAAAYYGVSIRLSGAGGGASNIPRYHDDGHPDNGWKTERLIVAQLKHETRPGSPFSLDLSPVMALRFEDDQLYLTAGIDTPAVRKPLNSDSECPVGYLRSYSHIASKPGAPEHDRFYQSRILLAREGDNVPIEFKINTPFPDLNAIECVDALEVSGPLRFGALPRDAFFDAVFLVQGQSSASPGRLALWINGRQIVSAIGNIGSYYAGGNRYFKFGVYGDFPPGKTVSIDYADFRRGPNCLDVLPRC